MKKIALGIICLFATQWAVAQQVIKGSELINGKLQQGYYLLLKVDSRDLAKEWQNYADDFGRISEPKRNMFTISRFRENSVANNDLTLQSQITDHRQYSKLFVFAEDVNTNSFNERGFSIFLEDFATLALRNELIRLATMEAEDAKKELSSAERELKRVERNIESNVKYQEKYGKLLDETPMRNEAIISEKSTILNDQLNATDSLAAVALQKKAVEKEKELLKVQKEGEKYSKRLAKKEKELDKLRDELLEARRQLQVTQAIAAERERVLRELKR